MRKGLMSSGRSEMRVRVAHWVRHMNAWGRKRGVREWSERVEET